MCDIFIECSRGGTNPTVKSPLSTFSSLLKCIQRESVPVWDAGGGEKCKFSKLWSGRGSWSSDGLDAARLRCSPIVVGGFGFVASTMRSCYTVVVGLAAHWLTTVSITNVENPPAVSVRTCGPEY